MAADSGTSIDHLLTGEPVIQPIVEEIKTFDREFIPPKSRPAFAAKSKGGIFGFKK